MVRVSFFCTFFLLLTHYTANTSRLPDSDGVIREENEISLSIFEELQGALEADKAEKLGIAGSIDENPTPDIKTEENLLEETNEGQIPNKAAGVVPTDSEFTFSDGDEGQVKWAPGCFIEGDDIEVVDIRSEDCGAVCVANPKCTHFAWYEYKCYIKNFDARPNATYRYFAVCGWKKYLRKDKPSTDDKTKEKRILEPTEQPEKVVGEQTLREEKGNEELKFLRMAINEVKEENMGKKMDNTAAFSCLDLYDSGHRTSGMNMIQKKQEYTGKTSYELVYCDLSEAPLNIAAGVVPIDREFTFYDGDEGQVKWAPGCYIDGDDIEVVDIRSEDCGGVCVANPRCTHFSWYKYKCYIKNFGSRPNATYRYFAVCGWKQDPVSAGMETRLGEVEVKWTPVFVVQRDIAFDNVNATIPFEVSRLNAGESINPTSGVFTAPRSGVYFFSFVAPATSDGSSETNVLSAQLLLNDVSVGVTSIDPNADPSVATLQSILKLKAGDIISMNLSTGSINANPEHLASFKGFLFGERM